MARRWILAGAVICATMCGSLVVACSGGSSAGSDAGADATQRSCTPGASVACTGVGGCAGGQVCAADGSGFGPCACGAADAAGGADAGPGDADGASVDGSADVQNVDSSGGDAGTEAGLPPCTPTGSTCLGSAKDYFCEAGAPDESSYFACGAGVLPQPADDFCCAVFTHGDSGPQTCVPDMTGCNVNVKLVGIGFRCSGNESPETDDSRFTNCTPTGSNGVPSCSSGMPCYYCCGAYN